ncbi:PAS domain S-box protein [Flavobacterium sp. N3904]|uniref:PAS domain S-box protein n=1 Tax=Flavobacterium sp. N3904 TaxID=2986835 RepID=UPI0022244AE1|nr:PAS domain S-box protein [Flavobacterium sp. N3904]
MDFHKHLQKQIRKHLPLELANDPSLQSFIQSINDSYLSFERDRELMDHSFQESEKEYHEINLNLKKEYALKQESISNLYDSLETLDENYAGINPDDDVDDLLFISKYLNKQIETRKATEESLSRTVELLKTLLVNLQSGILVEDENQNILFSNQLFWDQKKKSISPEETEGIDYSVQFEENKYIYKEPEVFVSRVKELLLHKKTVIGELIETTDNRFLERDFIPIFIDKIHKGHLWKFTDVTDRILNQKLLQQSEERSRVIMNASLNAIITVDDVGKITFWNEQAETIFGWKKEEIVGKIFSDYIVPPYNKENYDNGIKHYLTDGEDYFLNKQVELDAINKEGIIFPTEVSIIPITQNGETFFCSFIQDISKRKEAELQLSQTVELLKTLLANLQSGIMVESEKRVLLFTNQLFCDMRHIPVSPEELIGEDCTKIALKSKSLFKDSEHFVNRINEITNKHEIVIGELMETVEGTFYERDYIPIFIDEEYKGHLWKYTDVTQRIKNQTLLEQSEERSRNIMNASLNAIIMIDTKGRITFWNSQAESIFGWSENEVLGKTLNETIIPKQHNAGHTQGMKHYINTGEGPILNKQIELPALNKKGTEFPVEISIVPMHQNDELYFCSFIQDISERKKAESNLKFQEEKYRNIIANMNLGLIEVDNNEIIQFVNQSFATMSGFEVSELLGKNPKDLFVFGENKEKVTSKIALREQGISDLYQVPIKNKRGELKWWTISGGPNYDDNGNLIGSVGIHLDVTEQKQLEIDLESEKIKAQEASKAKETFLANMSHEIRTPLNAIIGFLRELEKQELTELQKKYIENSAIASKHLLSIINNILDISKIEAGEMTLEKEDFIFENSIKNVIRILKPKAKEKGLKLNFTISDQVNTVLKGDTLRLEQILYNLIGNALKFTSKGKISVDCNVIKDNTTFQELCLSIADTGIGMDQSFIENIFSKFSQEDKTITRKFGGTGLGMAITYELIQLMDAKIDIQSKRNEGTTIRIYANFIKGDPENISNLKQQEKKVELNGLSILLVEDNEMNRMVAQNTLQYYDCTITEAENGMEAISILKNKNFDIILMDLQMPEMDGYETTKIIRNDFKLTTPIIALTANAFKAEIEKCKNAGMNDYVTKPFDETILLNTIAKYTVYKEIENIKVPVTLSNEKLYNLNSLNNLSRGNSEFVLKMVRLFIKQTAEEIENITTALTVDDFQEVSRLIHKIKPSVESLGITSILEEIKLLEKIAKETTDKEQIKALFSIIKPTLLQVISLLQENELSK